MTFVELAQARICASEDSTQNIIAYLRILRHILQRKIMTVSLTVLSEMPLADRAIAIRFDGAVDDRVGMIQGFSGRIASYRFPRLAP